jgi:hypothetical protein
MQTTTTAAAMRAGSLGGSEIDDVKVDYCASCTGWSAGFSPLSTAGMDTIKRAVRLRG